MDIYVAAFGQLINFDKSSLTFNTNVKEEIMLSVSNIMGVQRGGGPGVYLGLPSLIGRNKKEILGFIKNKITQRMKSWNHKFLSRAGREVLLKSIIQAIPSFAMKVFLLPKGLITEIKRIMNCLW